MDIWSFSPKCFKQKGENFCLITLGDENKEVRSAGNYNTEKKDEDALAANSVLDN